MSDSQADFDDPKLPDELDEEVQPAGISDSGQSPSFTFLSNDR